MSKVTQKGQVTIPQKIRNKLGIVPGSSIKFRFVNGKCYIEKELDDEKIDKWIGYLKSDKNSDELVREMRGDINN